MTQAMMLAICGFMPHSHTVLTPRCAAAVQELVCSVPKDARIADDDPALPIFRDKGERIEDSKVDLADERVNGCD
jgi:hypothetical protein